MMKTIWDNLKNESSSLQLTFLKERLDFERTSLSNYLPLYAFLFFCSAGFSLLGFLLISFFLTMITIFCITITASLNYFEVQRFKQRWKRFLK